MEIYNFALEIFYHSKIIKEKKYIYYEISKNYNLII